MPRIIDYAAVLQAMAAGGLRCNYPMSGAFGFPPTAGAKIRGWIGPADSTIRPGLLPVVRTVPPPHAENLARGAIRVWQEIVPGAIWVMPLSHWHFELHDGSREWLGGALEEIHVDPAQLTERADGSALEFSLTETAETESVEKLVAALLANLRVSDFLLAFPGRPLLCNVHHHQQLWWTTPDPGILARLDEFTPA